MSLAESLQCIRCGEEYELATLFEGCIKCLEKGFYSNLTVKYEYSSFTNVFDNDLRGIWRFFTLLPVKERNNIVSLGEGNTPIVKSINYANRIGLKNLFLKNESLNPTWSFKDRFASVALSKAKEHGAKAVVASSSGNHGSSIAAYAARASIPCIIFALDNSPEQMLKQITAYNAKVITSPSVESRWSMMKRCVTELGLYPLTTYTPFPTGNPYGVEGYKTIAYEIFFQLKSVPDYICMPVGYGEGLYGVWKGFKELNILGLSDKLPRMISAESVYGAPLYNSYSKGLDRVERVSYRGPYTSFSIATTVTGLQSLVAMRESDGIATVVNEESMLSAEKELASYEGMFVEPSSAVAPASIASLVNSGEIAEDSTVVCILTSSGLKQTEVIQKATAQLHDMDCSDIKQFLEG
ncbi:MAG: threonine synthase [Conexivisphaerales archaeon]